MQLILAFKQIQAEILINVMIIRFPPKHGGDKFKVFVFCVGPYKVTIGSYIHVIKQLLNEAEYV